MKKSMFVFFFALSVLKTYANPILPSCKRLQVAKYNAPVGALGHTFIPMSFGKSQSMAGIKEKLPANAEVITVDIVYTDFPKGRSFDVLNEKRAQTLLEMYPGIKKNQIDWNLVGQTSCKTQLEAAALFHGVVVHYRIPPTKESIKSEISFLKAIGLPSSIELKTAKAEAKVSPESYERLLGAPVSKSKPATGSKEISVDLIFDSIEVNPKTALTVPAREDIVAAVFDRNKWKNMNIAADITGSMSPYTGQLLLWLSLHFNDNRVKQITFFNDGDMKPESQKKIGQIGGVYQTATCDMETVRKLAVKAMTGGGGGDAPENNIEGLLNAYQSNPDCKELIMVADALAPVKDMKLLDEIKVPVRIVLCGTYYGLQADYLRIAAKTGGSVHTIEEDILNLTVMKEGETIKICGRTYQIIKGTFVLIKSS